MRTQEKLREDLFKCLVYTGLAKQDDKQKVMEKLDKTLFYHILRFPHHANLHHVLARVVAQKFRGGKRCDHLGREIENYKIPSQWLIKTKKGSEKYNVKESVDFFNFSLRLKIKEEKTVLIKPIEEQLKVIKRMGLDKDVHVSGLSIYGSINEKEPKNLDKFLKLAETNPELFCMGGNDEEPMLSYITIVDEEGKEEQIELPHPMTAEDAREWYDSQFDTGGYYEE